LVVVETDEGISGVGSCSGNGTIIEVIIEKVLKPLLVGMDPLDIEAIWEKSYFGAGVREFGSRGVGVVALSGVDIALWDILGKARNLPVFELLGGARREKVEVYATALYPEEPATMVRRALGFAEQGFKGVKVKIGFDLARDMERVTAVRAALGKDFAIMSDANMGYEAQVALRAAAVLEECAVAWFEEPLFVEDIEGHASLKARCKVPIALGENLHTRFAFKEFVARGAVDILQPDVARAGGISEVKKIAALGRERGLPVSLHTYGDGVALAASLHLAAALENSAVMELDCIPNPLQSELLEEPFEAKNGLIAAPLGPGLGVKLNPLALEKYSFFGAEEVGVRAKALRVN